MLDKYFRGRSISRWWVNTLKSSCTFRKFKVWFCVVSYRWYIWHWLVACQCWYLRSNISRLVGIRIGCANQATRYLFRLILLFLLTASTAVKPREWIWDFAVPSDSLKSCEAKRMDLGMRKLFDFAVPSDGLWSLGNGFVIYFVVRETSHGIEDQLLIVDQRKTLGSIVNSRLFMLHHINVVGSPMNNSRWQSVVH